VHLEVCPTSNVHTGAAPSIADHPITALWRAGVSLSVHPDNRLMSRVTLSDEYAALVAHTPLTEDDLRTMNREALRHSFLGADAKAAAMATLHADLRP
jgi:adenosine deaminase